MDFTFRATGAKVHASIDVATSLVLDGITAPTLFSSGGTVPLSGSEMLRSGLCYDVHAMGRFVFTNEAGERRFVRRDLANEQTLSIVSGGASLGNGAQLCPTEAGDLRLETCARGACLTTAYAVLPPTGTVQSLTITPSQWVGAVQAGGSAQLCPSFSAEVTFTEGTVADVTQSRQLLLELAGPSGFSDYGGDGPAFDTAGRRCFSAQAGS